MKPNAIWGKAWVAGSFEEQLIAACLVEKKNKREEMNVTFLIFGDWNFNIRHYECELVNFNHCEVSKFVRKYTST